MMGTWKYGIYFLVFNSICYAFVADQIEHSKINSVCRTIIHNANNLMLLWTITDVEGTSNGQDKENDNRDDLKVSNSGHILHSHAASQPDNASSLAETSLGPLPNRSAKEISDRLSESFKAPASESTSFSSGTGVKHFSENPRLGDAASPVDTNLEHSNAMLHGAGNSTLGPKLLSLERKAECLDLQSHIKDLENRNQKLAAEKEELTNQFRVQIKVYST